MSRTGAVIVIDMQNGFCADGGSLFGDPARCARYRALVPPIQQLCAAARKVGMHVVYTRHGYRSGYPEAGSEITSLHPEVVRNGGMLWGTWDAEILPDLSPDVSDYVVQKSRFDAFLGTDLDLILQGLGVEELLVAGVSTNGCVESTVRTASQKGYSVAVASDATAATTTELHDGALRSMSYAFARVAPWEQLLAS